MKISELIQELEKIKAKDGDLEVKTQTLSHLWAPELKVVRDKSGAPRYVLLND